MTNEKPSPFAWGCGLALGWMAALFVVGLIAMVFTIGSLWALIASWF